ncbi:GGDEF domain-containing protein [Micromonospora sp. CPCC 205539]|uniref:GGDEF domain-containing protein n=1 Tax=Micromonospora sp. CPCC 205539 TaxID=3122408 RepID=UPI002FF262A4
MHVALSETARRWTPIVITALIPSVVLSLLLTGHAVVAGWLAAWGMAVQAILLAVQGDRAVGAVYRIAELEADLAVAYRDPVTGLAVRRVAERHIVNNAGSDLTVALIDVDGMHDINTAYTHDGGDRYLAELADRLIHAAEPGDLVARLGGDEFLVVTRRDPQALAGSLTAALAPPVTIGGSTTPMRVSIGICRTPGGDPHVALGQADRAMYTAKRSGTGIERYDPVRDDTPPSPGVRPTARHRDLRAARHGTANS